MKIYLAGKVSGPGDWRDSITSAFRGATPENGHCGHWEESWGYEEEWPISERAIFGEHDYTGPYALDCFHGEGCGAWGRNKHAAAAQGWYGDHSAESRRSLIFGLCLSAIKKSDLVFAWIDDPTCFGTLVEIGYAAALNKNIAVAFPVNSYHEDDFWFAKQCDSWCFIDKHQYETPSVALASIIKDRFGQETIASYVLAPKPSIYFIQSGDSGPIKVGWSANPGSRIRALQTANPHQLNILACIPGTKEGERKIHEMFSHYRLKGEWFEPKPDLLGFICMLRNAREKGVL